MICTNYQCVFLSSVPSRPPDFVTAYNTSSTSLVVKWSHVPRQYFGEKPIGYNIHYSAFVETDYKHKRVNYKTNTTTLTKLHVYAKYIIVVAAVSSDGEGPVEVVYALTGENRLLFLSCSVNWLFFSKQSSIHSFSFSC